jgi:hypothetical protein
MLALCVTWIIILDLNCLAILDEKCKLWSSSLYISVIVTVFNFSYASVFFSQRVCTFLAVRVIVFFWVTNTVQDVHRGLAIRGVYGAWMCLFLPRVTIIAWSAWNKHRVILFCFWQPDKKVRNESQTNFISYVRKSTDKELLSKLW